jgi:hypothetical protein
VFARLRVFVFFIGLLGFSLSSCQKETLLTPGGPKVIENAGAKIVTDTISSVQESNYNGIIDPTDEDEDDKDEDKEG